MVRKLQVIATTVDIHALPQDSTSHHTALDMPARPTLTPGAFPTRLTRLRFLPESKMVLCSLLGTLGAQVTFPLSQSFCISYCFWHKLGIVVVWLAVKLAHVEVDRPVGLVGVTPH